MGWALAAGAPRSAAALQPLLGRAAGHRVSRLWARAVAHELDIDLQISGTDHVDPAQQYLVMPLHESFMDVAALLHLPLDLRFAVREELLSLPHIGSYIGATHQIVVPETSTVGSYRSMYSDTAAAIAEGDSVVVFPQGSMLGVEVAFKAGVARLARRFGLPVLPIVLSGTHRIWEYPFTQTVRLGQRVAMSVLPPIEPSLVSPQTIRATERQMKEHAVERIDAAVRRFVPERDGWWDGYDFGIDSDFTDLSSRLAARRTVRP